MKAVSGNDKLSIEIKNGGFIDTLLHTKFINANNKYPAIKEDNESIWDRIVVIEFTEYFAPKDQKTRNKDELLQELKEEIPEIIMYCLDSLKELLREGHLKSFQGLEKNKEKLKILTDFYFHWFSKTLSYNSESKVTGKQCFAIWGKFAREYNYPVGSLNKLYTEIERIMQDKGYKRKKNVGQVFVGLEFKNNITNELHLTDTKKKTQTMLDLNKTL